jgi:hypothetical protein
MGVLDGERDTEAHFEAYSHTERLDLNCGSLKFNKIFSFHKITNTDCAICAQYTDILTPCTLPQNHQL